MSDLVGHPEDQFSRVAAQIILAEKSLIVNQENYKFQIKILH